MDSSDDRLVSPSDLTYHDISHRFSRLPTLTRPALNLLFAQCLTRLLQSPISTAIMSFLTVYILFADDIRVVAFSATADDYFYSLATTCICFFSLETAISFYSRPAYRFSFYFYLDCLSTLSLLADIGWIWERLMTSFSSDSEQNRRMQAAGKMSRASTQTPRVVRIVRLIRLIRLTKLYKHAQLVTRSSEGISPSLALPKESRIGQKLLDLTTKRLIVLALGLIAVFPLFDLSFYEEDMKSWEYAVGMLDQEKGSWGWERVAEMFIDYQEKDGRPVVFLSWTAKEFPLIWQSSTPLDALRSSEILYSTSDHFISIIDIRSDTQLAALLSIFKTVLAAIVLMGGAVMLSRDATNLVIIPIEKIMLKVQRLAENPLSIMDKKPHDVYDYADFKESYGLETAVIEQTIVKIGALLALSFGAAGAHMITASIANSSSPNFIMEGRKIMAIFAFCDIRNFTDVTEALGEGVMVFVNEIAAILHHTLDQHLGTPNANIGDAFLLVWKLQQDNYEERGGQLKIADTEEIANFADLTLICILKAIFQLRVDSCLWKYRGNSGILSRLPSYSVTLGFALHIGWAIEGPIGTTMKLDASYLSPHINLTMRLQECTKLYGVPVLISGHLHSLFTPQMQLVCRHIDTIAFQSSEFIVKVFTIDLDWSHLREQRRDRRYSLRKTAMKRQKMQWRLSKMQLKAADLLQSSRKLVHLRKQQESGFDSNWAVLMEEYEAGNWDDCRHRLAEAIRLSPYDGPAKVLMHVMAEQDFKASESWKGYRELSAI